MTEVMEKKLLTQVAQSSVQVPVNANQTHMQLV